MVDSSTEQPPQRDTSKIVLIVVAIVLALALVGVLLFVFLRPAGGVAPTSSPTASPSPSPRPTPTSSPAPTDAPGAQTCTVNELSVQLGAPDSGAGTTVVPIIFKNTGGRTCQIEGYPGVSFVGGGNGTQIGAPASRDASVAITFHELKPGDSVQSPLRITQAGNYDTCGTETADGLRIYPPHSYDAVFVATTAYKPCTDASVDLMSVQPAQ